MFISDVQVIVSTIAADAKNDICFIKNCWEYIGSSSDDFLILQTHTERNRSIHIKYNFNACSHVVQQWTHFLINLTFILNI